MKLRNVVSLGMIIIATMLILLAGCGDTSTSVATPKSAGEYFDDYFETVIEELKMAGFTNITAHKIEDLTTADELKEGYVESVSIAGDTFFPASAKFPKEAQVIVTYHAVKLVELPLSVAEMEHYDCQELAARFSDAGFLHVDTTEVFDLDPDTIDFEFENEVFANGIPISEVEKAVPFDATIVIVCHRSYNKYTVKMHIDFIANWIFNKYDIELYMDESYNATLKHGVSTDMEFRLKEGSHTLTLKEPDYTGERGQINLDVTSDIDVTYKFTCYKDEVEIVETFIDRKRALTNEEAKVPESASEWTYDNYQDVIASLEDAGFTNIKTEVLYDIVWGLTDEGEVKSVSVGGRTDFKKAEIFNKNVEIIVTYHMPEEDDPSRIPMPKDCSSYVGMNYKEVERVFGDLGFKNITLEKYTTNDDACKTGEVYSVKANYESFSKGDSYRPTDKVQIRYYVVEVPAESELEEPVHTAVSYSTNDEETAKKGNTGVFAYKNRGGSYDVYYIVDFDEGYVYYFTHGDGQETCDRVKIESGDLNSVVIITYHDGESVWSEGLHFKWKNQPDHLIWESYNHLEIDFYTTNLASALALKNNKSIVDY